MDLFDLNVSELFVRKSGIVLIHLCPDVIHGSPLSARDGDKGKGGREKRIPSFLLSRSFSSVTDLGVIE